MSDDGDVDDGHGRAFVVTPSTLQLRRAEVIVTCWPMKTRTQLLLAWPRSLAQFEFSLSSTAYRSLTLCFSVISEGPLHTLNQMVNQMVNHLLSC